MQHTPLHAAHISLKAKMAEFAGYDMPIQYPEGVLAEHNWTRAHAGAFDVSHMGQLILEGAGATAFLESLTPAAIEALKQNAAKYSVLMNEDGGMIDDLTLFCFSERDYRLAPTPSRVPTVLQWLDGHRDGCDVSIVNLGYRDAYLSIQGPRSRELISNLTDVDIGGDALGYFRFTSGAVAGVPDTVISRTGYSGELGYELFYPSEYASHMWDSLMEAGKPFDIRPCGLGALVTLRMEKKYPLYGLDISEDTTPVEADLGWTLRPGKGDFIGKPVLQEQKEKGTARVLVLLAADDTSTAFAIGDTIVSDNRTVGAVTSAATGHSVGKSLAMGYVEAQSAADQTALEIVSKDGAHTAVRVHRKPIYDPEGSRVRR